MLDILNAIIANKVSGGSGSGASGGLPTVSAPHQMLVTDAEGKTVWEERTHYDTGRVLVNKAIEQGDITDNTSSLVRLSEIPFAEADLGKIAFHSKNGDVLYFPTEAWIIEAGAYAVNEVVFNIYADNVTAFDMTFPTKGVYVFPVTEGFNYPERLVLESVRVLDEKYIPGSVKGGVFDVVVSQSGDTYTANKTVAECIAAHKSGKIVRFFLDWNGGMYAAYVNSIIDEDEYIQISFVNFMFGSDLTIQTYDYYAEAGNNDSFHVAELVVSMEEK